MKHRTEILEWQLSFKKSKHAALVEFVNSLDWNRTILNVGSIFEDIHYLEDEIKRVERLLKQECKNN